MTRKVLAVGSSGVFAARLTDGILATSDLDVVVAGRDRGRCEVFAPRTTTQAGPVSRSRSSTPAP